MVAKKQESTTESTTESVTESTTTEPAPEQAPEPQTPPDAVPAPEPTPEDAATAAPSDPTRAGGYVITERGWELDPAIAATPEQEG